MKNSRIGAPKQLNKYFLKFLDDNPKANESFKKWKEKERK